MEGTNILIIRFENIIKLFFISIVLGVSISYSKLYLFHIVLSILILSYVYIKINNLQFTIIKLPTKLHYIFYFMLFWYTLSINWSINSSYSIKYLFYIICGLSIIIVTIYYLQDLKKQEKLFKILSIVFILEIIISLLEAFTDLRLPVSPFSQYVTYFDRSMRIGENINSDAMARIMTIPTGFQWNPNNLAVTMLIIAPFFLLNKNNILKYVGMFSIFVIIFMSGSRGVLIAFSFMLILYMFLLSKKRFIIFSSMIPIVFILLVSLNFDTLKNSKHHKIREFASTVDALVLYINSDIDSSSSIGKRQQLIKNGLIALKNSNYLGVGGGGSIAVQEQSNTEGKRPTTNMHNFWIEMLVDSGILFSFFFVMWYIYVVLKLHSIGSRTKDTQLIYYSQALFLSMSAFTIGSISASTVIYLLPMWLMFGLSIATINNYERIKSETTSIIKI